MAARLRGKKNHDVMSTVKKPCVLNYCGNSSLIRNIGSTGKHRELALIIRFIKESGCSLIPVKPRSLYNTVGCARRKLSDLQQALLREYRSFHPLCKGGAA